MGVSAEVGEVSCREEEHDPCQEAFPSEEVAFSFLEGASYLEEVL